MMADACRTKDTDKARCGFNKAALYRVAGNEHELQAFNGMGERQGTEDDDEKHHKQSRHTDFVELLNTFRDTALHDDHADDDKQCGEDNASDRGGEHCAEDLAAAHCDCFVTEAELSHIQGNVLQAVAAENGVEAHDEERGYRCKPADPCELLGNFFVSINRAELRLTADSQFGAHDDHAYKNCKQQIDDQEDKSAALTHLIREAPDIAETDRRTNCRKQETDV